MKSSDHKPTKIYEESPYLSALAGAPVKPGAIYDIEVRHDSWCDLLLGRGFCNCNPEIAMREITAAGEGQPRG